MTPSDAKHVETLKQHQRTIMASARVLPPERQTLVEALTYALRAIEERDQLLAAVGMLLDTNGGPIDADDTVDGNVYVLVLRGVFLRLESMLKEGSPSVPKG